MRKYKASRSNDSHVSNNGTLNTNYLHYIWFNEYCFIIMSIARLIYVFAHMHLCKKQL